MYNDNVHKNPWAEYTRNEENSFYELRKSIREQKILLDAATNTIDSQDDGENAIMPLSELKLRIITISKELAEKQQTAAYRAHSTQTTAQWWSRYKLNLRQLEDLSDQHRVLLKEINYLIDTGVKKVQEDLVHETEKLSQLLGRKAQIEKSASSYTTEYDGLSDSDRIKAKAQAMVAARLKKNNYSSHPIDLEHRQIDVNEKLARMDHIIDEINLYKADLELIINNDLNKIEDDLTEGTKDLKERQMFEQGLYVDDHLARFIDQLDRVNPPNIPPFLSSLPRHPESDTSVLNQTPPPPIPTSQRPGTPRSAASIKAEAHRRIEERKHLFIPKETVLPKRVIQSSVQITDEEKAAQERMRQAEAGARARLEAMREKRNKLRQEAAEAEEKKKKAASEAAAAAEAEMLAEKKRKKLEEEERLAKIKKIEDELEEKQRKEREAESERLITEREERAKKEAEERKKREEEEHAAEEERQKRARQAAEQAAQEKRLRRLEIEKQEKELEAARQEEINRRKKWEEAERQKQQYEEQRLMEKQEEALRLRQHLEEEQERLQQQRRYEEEQQKRLDEEARLEQQKIYEAEQKLEKERQLMEERKKTQELAERQVERQAEEESEPSYPWTHASTTAGTSGYGVDIEDEVNFSIIYRVNTLYEYQGIREDDLSFSANETLKAHPSKDKGSDWWYGTSLSSNQVGFFPRTYVEVIEEAFRVKTLYEFKKARDDDLGFFENEVIVVQPFQDDNSDWWYGTNEDTQESGYFPKSYVEKIHSTKKTNSATKVAPIPIQNPSNTESMLTINDQGLSRGLSAPNTPVMKKTNLKLSKAEMTKRRRAASNVSTASNSHISTPRLIIPHTEKSCENLELLTWASTMDPIELEAISHDERKRQEAIFELIATERSYLNDLQMIINVFYTDSGKYLTQDERDVVFSNIDDLLICNTSLFSDMETRQRERANVIDNIGDVFLTHADSLKCYSSYCRNQSYATKFLQKKRENDQWFDVFLRTAQTRPECRSLDLSHFLLEPVQRITRYPLLLRQILNCTPKKHADYALVKSALSVAQRVLEDVNEETRRYENIQKMSELARVIDMEATGRLNIPGREFVMDGILFKAKSGRKLHGFLFNDIMLLAEPLKQLSPKGYLYSLYREPLPLERVSVRQQQTMAIMPSFSSSNNADDLSFQIVSGNQVIAVKTSTASQKRQWMSQIQHYSAYQQYN